MGRSWHSEISRAWFFRPSAKFTSISLALTLLLSQQPEVVCGEIARVHANQCYAVV